MDTITQSDFNAVVQRAATLSEENKQLRQLNAEWIADSKRRGLEIVRLKHTITALQTQRKLNVRWEALLRLEVTEKQPWIKWNEEDIPALQAVTADDVTSALRLAFKSQPAIHIITTEDKAE